MALERFPGIRRRVRSPARHPVRRGFEGRERGLVVPVGDVELAAVPAVAARCPDELAAVRRRHGQAVEAVRVGDPDRFLRALRVDDEDLEVLETELVRGEEDVLARGVLVRGPAHRAEVGQLPLVRAVEIHRPDVGYQAVLAEAPPDDAGTVSEEEGAAVVSRHVREPGLFAAVGAHDVDLAEVRGVDFQQVCFALGEFPVEGVAGGGEDDPLAVRGVGAFGVVAGDVRQPAGVASGHGHRVDLHLRVVVPGVAPLPPGGAEVELLLLQLGRARVVVGRRVQDRRAVRANEGAGRLADSGRHLAGVSGGQIEQVDLVERILRPPFALEHELAAVGREVTLAGALSLVDQAPGSVQERALVECVVRGGGSRERGEGSGCQRGGPGVKFRHGGLSRQFSTNPLAAGCALDAKSGECIGAPGRRVHVILHGPIWPSPRAPRGGK